MARDNDEIISWLVKLADKADSHTQSMASLDKKVDLHIQKTELELQRIKETDDIQNQLLDAHIEGVNTLKKMYDKHEEQDIARFAKLEPKEMIKSLGKETGKIFFKTLTIAGAIATAVVGLIKLIRFMHWL